METAEEKADKTLQSVDEWVVYNDGYAQGYTEAMLWKDPKVELPENVGLYLCKCEKKLGFYFDIVFFNKVWRSDNVIGWRPIE